MGNKLGFLLDYHKYIDNINKLLNEDDNKMYKSFLKQTKNGNLILTEGLIKTYPLLKSVEIIKTRFPYLNVEKEDDGEIYIEGIFQKISKYIPLFTNLGYFISNYTIDGKKWLTEDFDDNMKPVALFLEPKYDIKLDKIPNVLYHTSHIKFKNKISKIGFIPKSGEKISKHPERIYLTDNLNVAISFGENIKKEYNEGYCIYEIKGECINVLYSDINLRNGGYYTNQNIPPKCFNLIKESKL